MFIESNLDKKEQDIRITDMQRLLADPDKAKIVEFGMALSPKNKWAQDQDKLGVKLLKDKFATEYGTSFSEEEIIKEAKKYNLAFVPAKDYTGEYTAEFISKVKEFAEAHKLGTSAQDLQDVIYILAPQQHRKEKLTLKDNLKDPLFFGRVMNDRNLVFYTLIGGNKNYVNLYNWFMGIRNRNVALYLLTSVLGVIFATYGGWYLLKNILHVSSVWYYIPVFIVGIVAIVLDIVKKETDSTNDEKYEKD